MTTSRLGSARRFGAAGILSLFALSGCGTDAPTSTPFEALAARGGGGGGSGDGPTVRAADPDTGLRNTTIDVRVLGSAFDNGSRAVWAIDGDTAFATTRITTNSTRFVRSGELVANITIAGDAPLTLYDIVVVTAAGKNGIGIEQFAVKNTGSGDPFIAVLDDATGYKLRSDGGGPYVDSYPDYSSSCVDSKGFAGGVYQLRTIANTGTCKAVQRPAWRWFRIELGSTLIDLDQDGTAEAIEDAPGRLLASDGFAHGATSSPAKIYILVVNTDGSTTQNAKYELAFRAGVSVTDIGNGGRILEAPAGSATVDIYGSWTRSGKPQGPPLATLQLPFKLTLNPM